MSPIAHTPDSLLEEFAQFRASVRHWMDCEFVPPGDNIGLCCDAAALTFAQAVILADTYTAPEQAQDLIHAIFRSFIESVNNHLVEQGVGYHMEFPAGTFGKEAP